MPPEHHCPEGSFSEGKAGRRGGRGPLESKKKKGAKGALTKGLCAVTPVSFLPLTRPLISQSCFLDMVVALQPLSCGPLALERNHGCGCQMWRRGCTCVPGRPSQVPQLPDSGETVGLGGLQLVHCPSLSGDALQTPRWAGLGWEDALREFHMVPLPSPCLRPEGIFLGSSR